MSDTNKTIAVFGATGRQGGAVANELHRRGWSVRAITRNPDSVAAAGLNARGINAVQGDLRNPASLEAALHGAVGVFGVTDYWEHGLKKEVELGKGLINAAVASGVRHFVFSSVGGTDRTEGMGISHFDSKREIEAHLRSSGLPYTIFRPVTFYENFITPRFRRQICRAGVLRFCIHPNLPFQMVAMKDVGVFAAKAFAEPEDFIGQELELASDRFSMNDFATGLGKHLGTPVRYEVIPEVAQWLVGGYVAATRQSGHFKVGRSLINQFRWNNGSACGGWNADLQALRRLHPDLVGLNDWIKSVNWTAGL